MTALTPWQRERESSAAPTPADAEGYAPDAAPECWVRRPVGGAVAFAIVLWHDARRGWLLRLGPQHKCLVVGVRLLSPDGDGPPGAALVCGDRLLLDYGYTLEPA